MSIRSLKEIIFYIWNKPKLLNVCSIVIGSFAIFYLLFLCYAWVVSHKHFALKNVVLEVVNNDNPNIDRGEIKRMIGDTLNGTTLNTNLQVMLEIILDNPWVDQVVIRRVWPSTIVIKLKERRLIALWNKKFLISEYGEITKIPTIRQKKIEEKLGCYLIKVEGPEDFLSEIIERAETTNNLLTHINEHLLQLNLTAQYAWEAKTNEGMILKFGGDDLQSSMYHRLENFTKSYTNLKKTLLKKGIDKSRIHYVDLRYAKGFAIRTESNNFNSSRESKTEPCLMKYKRLTIG